MALAWNVSCWHEPDHTRCPQLGRYRGKGGHNAGGVSVAIDPDATSTAVDADKQCIAKSAAFIRDKFQLVEVRI
jgi:hypothetical protein